MRLSVTSRHEHQGINILATEEGSAHAYAAGYTALPTSSCRRLPASLAEEAAARWC